MKFKARIGVRALYGTLIVGLMVMSCEEDITELPAENEAQPAEELYTRVERPFPNIPIEYQNFQVDAQEGLEWMSDKGSIIRVPPNALVDKNGDPIKGKVDFKFDEMKDMVDVFLSGVPMTYDSNGVQQHFESAGMFELRAEQDGNPVFIDPKKAIVVDLASENIEEKFNIYQYDESNQKWTFAKKDDAKFPPKIEQDKKEAKTALAAIKQQVSALKAKIGVEPEKAIEGELNFRVVYDKDLYPELAVYDDLLFQILNKERFKPEYSSYEWSSVDIDRNDDETYKVNFKKPDMTLEYECKPVFGEENYEKAKADFEKRHKKSKGIIENLKRREEERKARYAKLMEEYEAARIQDSIRRAAWSASWESNAKVMRQFEIRNFGFYNSDCPSGLPQGKRLLAATKDENEPNPDSLLYCQKLYLVEKNSNTLFTLNSPEHLSYNPKSENIIWFVTSDNKLAIFEGDKFDRINQIENNTKAILDMKLIDVDFKDEASIRKYLNLKS